MPVAANIIVMWPGTNASIPSGWTRETTLDSRYCKGTAVVTDPNVTGGASTHGHSASSHSHTVASHTHTDTVGDSTPSSDVADLPVNNSDGASDPHKHSLTSGSSSPTSGGGTNSWTSASSDPSFFDVIYIKSDGTPTGFPQDCMMFRNDSVTPSGWTQNVASKTRYFRGAAAAGNGGGTGGGGHTHSNSGTHTHTMPDHDHGTGNSGAADLNAQDMTVGGEQVTMALDIHVHSVNWDNGHSGGDSSSGSASNASTTNEPVFFTLWAIQNDTAGNDYGVATIGNIAMWLGTLTSIPAAWFLCDGTNSTPDLRNNYIKAANVSGDIGTIGGSASHGHTGGSHSHSSATSHTHTYPNSGNADIGRPAGAGPGAGGIKIEHHIPAGTSDGTSPGYNAANAPTTTNSDAQPAFRTVAYLEVSTAVVDLTGAQPASTGTITQEHQIVSVGAQPSATGTIAQEYQISIVGSQPAATGTVTVLYFNVVEGSQPAATGAIAAIAAVSIQGVQPASSGALSLFAFIGVSGSQPAGSGTLSLFAFIGLSGNQPAATATSQPTFLIATVGNQPTATGSIGFLYLITLAGAQLASTGTILGILIVPAFTFTLRTDRSLTMTLQTSR